MAMRLNAAYKTDVGQQREQNEDACYARTVEEDGRFYGLYIVADGMGGYHAGEVASEIAVKNISAALEDLLGPQTGVPTQPLRGRRAAKAVVEAATASDAATTGEDAGSATPDNATRPLDETIANQYYLERLSEAIKQTSKDIVEHGLTHKDARGLGSTVTAALVIGVQAYVANVGDSRTYLMRDGTLQRLTVDHSLVERLVEAGQIRPEQVYDHPSRNLIYRSLGADHADVDVDVFVCPLQDHDTLLLCSDGLWEMVRDPELASILAEDADLQHTVETLIDRANHNGGEDNISAVLVRCQES